MTNKHPVTKDKALAVIDGPIQDVEWASIVDSIVDDLMDDDIPDKVIRATELMVCGWPIYKIAKELGAKPSEVKGWLSKYPRMAMAVSNGRKLLTAWRMNTMEQQFAMAVEKSGEILGLSLRDDTVDPKLVSAVGLHARYILGLFAGKEIDVNIHMRGEDQTLKAKEDALEYLASSIAAKREEEEPIEGVFVVEEISKEDAPLLDHEGNSAFGVVGTADVNEDGLLCHICGDRTWAPGMHVISKHKMKSHEYETVFMLPMGTLKSINKNRPAQGGATDGE
jgi:hypothetical protein